jgi:hypothetical protein
MGARGSLALTLESNLDSLLAYGGFVVAHECFSILTPDEFPEGRCVYLLREAAEEIQHLPVSPGEEDPDVSSHQQVMELFRHYILNRQMQRKRDYRLCSKRLGLWKWKTRTVRMAGMYWSTPNSFVVAHAGFARKLKRGGRAIKQKEAEFAQVAAERLTSLGVITSAWHGEDPHYDAAISFDID